jgi:hypothetical protein
MSFGDKVAAKAAQNRAAEAEAVRLAAERHARAMAVLVPFGREVLEPLRRIAQDDSYIPVFGGKTLELDTSVQEQVSIVSAVRDDNDAEHIFRVTMTRSREIGEADVSVVFMSDDMSTPTMERTFSDYMGRPRGYRVSEPATLTVPLAWPGEAAEFIEDMLVAFVAANAPADRADQEQRAEPGLLGRLFRRCQRRNRLT